MEIPIKTKKQRILDIGGWTFTFLFVAVIIFIVFNGQENVELQRDQIKLIVLIMISIPLLITSLIKNYFLNGYSGKIKIDANGVDFETNRKHVFLSWDDIEYVVITKGFHIRLFTSEYYNKASKMPYTEYPRVDVANVTDDYIYIPYSAEALAEVKKYSRKEVVNEYILYLKRNSL
ncbi:MAG: hypothetical protein JXN65_11965 [Clostridia bacterium]|nr:hypothetical protein [Clostridia bacterium]